LGIYLSNLTTKRWLFQCKFGNDKTIGMGVQIWLHFQLLWYLSCLKMKYRLWHTSDANYWFLDCGIGDLKMSIPCLHRNFFVNKLNKALLKMSEKSPIPNNSRQVPEYTIFFENLGIVASNCLHMFLNLPQNKIIIYCKTYCTVNLEKRE